jgi:hypothetical protein
MPTGASALLLCLLELAASPPRIRVDIVFEGTRMQPRREVSAMEEVARIWANYGVDIRRANPDDTQWDGALRLTVVLVDYHNPRVAGDVLASISFSDDLPRPTIVMYPTSIATLVSTTTLFGRSASEWSIDFRELILGRVLGRALAHEIGHFLLRSPQHSAAGLMRAQPPVSDLIDPRRQHFALSADEVKRLVWVMSTSFQSYSQ